VDGVADLVILVGAILLFLLLMSKVVIPLVYAFIIIVHSLICLFLITINKLIGKQ